MTPPCSDMPFMMAPMACSRMPNQKLRPPGVAAVKCGAPLTVVRFEPARSAEPPMSSGILPAIALRTTPEAARLATAAGIDFSRVRAAMLHGSAASRVLEVFGGRMATRDFAAGVEARLHHKDYALLLDEAMRLGAPLPVSVAVGLQLNALMARGWSRDDTSALLRVLETGGRRGPAS